MKVGEFDFELPERLIAQEPAAPRDASRLLVLDRETGEVTHRHFTDLAGELRAGDLVVINDTKVIPARLLGTKPTGGRVEVLLVEALASDEGGSVWRAMIDGSRSLRPGAALAFAGGLRIELVAREGELWRIRLLHEGTDLASLLEMIGDVPLPPYIRRAPGEARSGADRERYQTIFARTPGAIAAPTAGLHWTAGALEALRERGVTTAALTLHVGPGTFLPVRVEDVADHRMHKEAYSVPPETAAAVAEARARGGWVVAVGTTVARTLESCADGQGGIVAGSGRSDLFIYPGFRFRVVDALVTNFHLPKSTLLMLVCAFAGRTPVLAAYREAVREGYRFYSYGDAMLIRSA